MKIAIDIDGVIYDTQKYIMIYLEIFDIDELHRNSLVKPEEFWSNVRYSWSEEENQKFDDKILEITQKAGLVPGAKEVIKLLQKRGVQTIVVTSRGNIPGEDNEKMVEIVQKRLNEDDLTFDKIYWKQVNKVEICQKENVDFLIDDSPIVCKETSKSGIKTIFLRDSGTKKLAPNPHLFEVHNWGEVYRILTDFDCGNQN